MESGNPERFFACGVERKRRSLWGLESWGWQGRLANGPDGAGARELSFVFILVGCLGFECVREKVVEGLSDVLNSGAPRQVAEKMSDPVNYSDLFNYSRY